MAEFENTDLGVYTSTLVRGGKPVLLVFHDLNGDWEFLSSEEHLPEQTVRAHLRHLLERDETLHQVADLPLGWKAWRWSPEDIWHREKTPEDQPEF